MLFDRILGNLRDLKLDTPPPPGVVIDAATNVVTDVVTIEWRDCDARALRATTAGGRRIGILVPIGRALRDGDVLTNETGETLAVRVPPATVWVARPSDASTLAAVALELGNLHVPVEVAGAELVVVPDGPTREVFERYGVSFKPESRSFAPLRATVLQGVKLAETFEVRRNAGNG